MARLEISLRRNVAISAILDRTPKLALPNWYLGAGCISQTVWNELHSFAPDANIKDYDLVYFDGSDLSYKAEDSRIKKGRRLFQDLDLKLEIKNEARVHLWYEEHFGYAINPYRSVEEAIRSWPTTATCVGVRTDGKKNFEVYAPFGLDDLYGMIIRPNKGQVTKEVYMEKARRWKKLWPRLHVIPWD